MAAERHAAGGEAVEVGGAHDGVAGAAQAAAPPLVDRHEEDVETGHDAKANPTLPVGNRVGGAGVVVVLPEKGPIQ
jgi:hypothetical protein